MTPTIGISRGPLPRLAALLAVALLVIGCGSGAAAPNLLDAAGGPTGAEAGPTAGPAAPDADGGNGTPVLGAARPELLIIKTGSLELQVEAVEAAVAAAEARITALGGYVSGSEQFGEGEDISATITYRVPVDQWSAALKALRELAFKVVSERTTTDDVTGQVVDLRSRIANLQATEKALQAIMTQATKISDVLEVQAELTKVRGQIEEATGQKQHLAEQAGYSTLSVRFGVQPEAAVTVAQDKFDPGAEVDRATANLVEILQGLATAGIWFGIVWLPILLALGLIGLAVYLVIQRRGGAAGAAPSGAGPQPPMPPMPPTEPATPAAGG
ncbi:MAG: DUF4349 domain-containing protein [Chloroflexi bacterium]|nr:DUF4349 domain-containing protein [Chloroflexota bacterium]